jgi:DNA-binding LacI/PurR family transcriptional regulator
MKYLIAEDRIFQKVSSLPTGAKLPTFQELKTELEVSQSTLDRALRSLERKKAIFKKRGSGIYVSGNNGGSKRKTFNIGVLVSDITNRFCALLVKGIESELSERGYRMILCNGASELEKEIDVIFSMKEKIDALIVFPSTSNAINSDYAGSLIELEKKTGVPFVFVDIAVSGVNGNFIGFDQYGAFYETASKMLSAFPERQIMYIGQPGSVIGAERFLGFRDAILNQNIPIEKISFFYFCKELRSSFRELIRQAKRTPAVAFVANPDLLMELATVVRKENMLVPEDIIIAGIVEEDYLAYLDLPIISMKKPSMEMGRKAARMALDLLHGKRKTESLRLKLEEEISRELMKFWK